MKEITRDWIESEWKALRRDPRAHKGTFGKVLVVAGSVGMAGAALLCGRAALRTGSGLLRFAVPEDIRDILQIACPEATVIVRSKGLDWKDYDALVFGPGLGMNEITENEAILREILNEYRGPLVVDADGLNLIARQGMQEELRASQAKIIITPHAGEASRLLAGHAEHPSEKEPAFREEIAETLAKITGAVAVLKGHETLVAKEDGTILKNTTGNPGMATGGSGDVLAGIIASLAGQGLSSWVAASTGVALHGHAGDRCARELGQAGMIAGDLVEAIPRAFEELSTGTSFHSR